MAACQGCQAQSFRGLPIPIIGYEDHLVPDDEWASRKRVFGGAPCAFHLVLVVHHFVSAAHSGVSAWQWTGGSCAYYVRPAFGDVLHQKLGVPARLVLADNQRPDVADADVRGQLCPLQCGDRPKARIERVLFSRFESLFQDLLAALDVSFGDMCSCHDVSI